MVDYGGSYKSIFKEGSTIYVKDDFYENWMKNMSVAKYCPRNAKENGCLPEYDYKVNDGSRYYNPESIYVRPAVWVLKDGLILKPYYNSEFMHKFLIDINGFKKPNKLGRDVFMFGFNEKKIYPENYTPQEGGRTSTQMMDWALKN